MLAYSITLLSPHKALQVNKHMVFWPTLYIEFHVLTVIDARTSVANISDTSRIQDEKDFCVCCVCVSTELSLGSSSDVSLD